ncbi:PQ-loop domain-containing transporter [Francisella sp. XLW-1]|uniref:PQ-loop domain-containing transporter n=1 Tax=Francisella sp. XLW-1 TaxID=2610887 RepID=UPI00123CB6C4|nr:PQ-loop domain-containing transporter [Francisella sp. XLW-1]
MELSTNTQELSELILNISLIIYLIQFVPQIIYNAKNKKSLDNISMLTQFSMLIFTLCCIVQIVDLNLDWRLLVISIGYLIGITVQQLQISFNNKRMPEVINLIFVMLITIAILAIRYKPNAIYMITTIISVSICFVYWLPQTYKNYKQKHFTGYCLLFIVLAWLGSLCHLINSFLLSSPLIIKLGLIAISVTIPLLAFQKLLYRNSSKLV